MAQRKRSGGEINFESSLQKLEAIVKQLEEEEIPLEVSLKLFAEGQTLARACEEQLKAAENQIKLLIEKPSGKLEEVDFESPDSDHDNESANDDDGDDADTAGVAKQPSRDAREPAAGDGERRADPPRPDPKKDASAPARDLDELPF